jgi:uncharacterized membrane protein YeiH
VPVPQVVTTHLDEFITFLTYMAVVASAMSGALEARHQRMDVVGAVSVALVTAFGGGTLRDMLLGRTPIFWLLDPWLTVAALLTGLITYYGVRTISGRVLVVPDALGLGLFTMLGATYALQMKLSLVVSVLMGVVTGIFGGVLRDTFCNRVPLVFRRDTELYATCAFVGVWVFVLLYRFTTHSTLASWVGIAITVALRLATVRFNLMLPDLDARDTKREE